MEVQKIYRDLMKKKICPFCGYRLALKDRTRHDGRFSCPACKKSVDYNAIALEA